MGIFRKKDFTDKIKKIITVEKKRRKEKEHIQTDDPEKAREIANEIIKKYKSTKNLITITLDEKNFIENIGLNNPLTYSELKQILKKFQTENSRSIIRVINKTSRTEEFLTKEFYKYIKTRSKIRYAEEEKKDLQKETEEVVRKAWENFPELIGKIYIPH